jgi:pyruvate-ferredoxin/flavodoxin oxidoreductase
VLRIAAPDAIFVLNSPYGPEVVWDRLPRSMQRQIIDKRLRFFVIDASKAAREVGLRGRTNTILQTCFFALSGVLLRDDAIRQIKASIRKTYADKGEEVIQRNFRAVDGTLARLHEVKMPREATSAWDRAPLVPASAPEFVKTVTAKMLEGRGDEIPVSLMPVDGAFPSDTAAYEKRNVAEIAPLWEPTICVQCGQCSFVCPHAVIRAKYYYEAELDRAPESFRSAPVNVRGFPDVRFSLQFYVEDCTGCGLCVEICPATASLTRGAKPSIWPQSCR